MKIPCVINAMLQRRKLFWMVACAFAYTIYMGYLALLTAASDKPPSEFASHLPGLTVPLPLSAFATPTPKQTVPLPPLYTQDPHDLRTPTLPLPSCLPSRRLGLDIAATSKAITDFCMTETRIISSGTQRAISKTYPDLTRSQGTLRLLLSWENTDACLRSQMELSPTQNAGRSCETIFHKIIQECKSVRFVVSCRFNVWDQVLRNQLEAN